MIHNELVKQTVYVSLLMQLVTTLISLDGLNYNLLPRDSVLHDILILEAIVQFIEAGFYIWVILSLKDLDKMTSRRYIDWVFTTPTMLVSTIVFMEYLRIKQENKDSFTLIEFIKTRKQDILIIATLNLGMLVFGFLGEIGVLSVYKSVAFGTIPFVMSFKFIYDNYARHTELGKGLFWVMFTLWSLYAVAACLPVVGKNALYNILDVFAKNFYGLFIYYYVTTVGQRKRLR